MRSFESSFWDRDDAAIADLLDKRVDKLAGFRVPNFAAGANLKMTAPVQALHKWRKNRNKKLGISASVAAALSWALESDPLFAALFDGRDELLIPERPSVGVGLDEGDMAKVLVVGSDEYSSPVDLAEKLESRLVHHGAKSVEGLSLIERTKSSDLRKTRRWLKMAGQELRERFDYLVPTLQKKRFENWASQRGHVQVHNLGTHGVQEFKGFLRRPWVSMLWVLEEDEIVKPSESGGFESVPVIPLILVYAQELIAVDRACAFLSKVVEAIADPSSCLEGDK